MTPLDILYKIIYIAIVLWVVILLYHAFDEYTKTDKLCITGETISKTSETIKSGYKAIKSMYSKEQFEDVPTGGVEPQPYVQTPSYTQAPATTYTKPSASPSLEPVVTIGDAESPQPNIATSGVSDNFKDALLEMAIDDSMIAQHEKFVQEADFGSNDALYHVEREPVDVIPWVGLRRVNYAAVPVSDGARSIASVAGSEELPKSMVLKW